ncbi:MAG TPA: sigma-70 family RNA polymerase sigma factor [Candidatus Avirikenella pullistercoris]|nr:sigma-70 family RNA polymerase sigma factor [Candidatus Avirikenella pullistercoris]
MAITKNTELQLINKSLAGDQAAFEKLFNIHKEAVKAFLIKLSGSEFDANDLLQETFIKAFLNLEKYNSQYTFTQWLIVIAKNTFIDYVRKKGDRGSLLLIDSGLANDIIGDNPEELIMLKERKKEIEAEIENLSVNYRTIIEMRYYLGLSYEEIAEELNIPIGTVKIRLFRAKEQLNKILKKH